MSDVHPFLTPKEFISLISINIYPRVSMQSRSLVAKYFLSRLRIPDFESGDPGSNPGGTIYSKMEETLELCSCIVKIPCRTSSPYLFPRFSLTCNT